MKIKLKELTSNGLLNAIDSTRDEVYKHIKRGEMAEARAFVSGLCAGFALGTQGDALQLEDTEMLLCELIVDVLNLESLIDVKREE